MIEFISPCTGTLASEQQTRRHSEARCSHSCRHSQSQSYTNLQLNKTGRGAWKNTKGQEAQIKRRWTEYQTDGSFSHSRLLLSTSLVVTEEIKKNHVCQFYIVTNSRASFLLHQSAGRLCSHRPSVRRASLPRQSAIASVAVTVTTTLRRMAFSSWNGIFLCKQRISVNKLLPMISAHNGWLWNRTNEGQMH